MKASKFHLPLKILIAAALIAPLCAGAIPFGVSHASTTTPTLGDKVSTDLRQKVNSGVSKVDVIVQSASSWTTTLTDAVKTNSGTITRSYKNFNARAISLPPAAV